MSRRQNRGAIAVLPGALLESFVVTSVRDRTGGPPLWKDRPPPRGDSVGPRAHGGVRTRGTSMTTHVTVDQDLYARQGIKLVVSPDGSPRELRRGELADPGDRMLDHDGEPRFQVRLGVPARTDADVPDELGLALRRVADRLPCVTPDGHEDPATEGETVEWVTAPFLFDGTLVIRIDTDGFGFNPAMIEGMVAIFLDELEPLGITAYLTAGPELPDEMIPPWRSTAERESGQPVTA
jgi:hypothetical protein